MRHINIPIFVAHMGCPFTCVFCNQKSITHTQGGLNGQQAEQLIERAVSTLPKEAETEIAFFGGSFSGIEEERQEALLEAAAKYVRSGAVKGIRLSTRPDMIDERVLTRFARYGVTAVELGAQSMDDRVLRASGRGHTAADTVKAAKQIKEAGFELGLQLMLGLPEDTSERCENSVREVIALAPATTRLYPALVLRGTELEERYRTGTYQPLSLDEAVEQCSRFAPMIERAGVRILRLGLMAEENLNPDRDLVTGPYHPAFGELVRGRMLSCSALKHHRGERVLVVHPADLSKLLGHGGHEKRWLEQQIGFEIGISTDFAQERNNFIWKG